MAVLLKQLTIPVTCKDTDSKVAAEFARAVGIPMEDIKEIRIKKKSLDARRKREIKYHYNVEADLRDEALALRNNSKLEKVVQKDSFNPIKDLKIPSKKMRLKPVIIGLGPAGTFAAHVFAEAGIGAIVVERGEPVEDRLRTVRKLSTRGELNEESNYCFGEGGAGTFSDGKLTCGRNHPYIKYLFEQWVRFGAPEEILYDAHPHIGTDYLMRVALNMRKYIEKNGGEVLFNKRMVNFRKPANSSARYEVELCDGTKIETDHLIVAIGHSARDTYHMMLDNGVAITPKPFAVGARIEHPQEIIDEIQFGSCDLLPAAEYKLTAQQGERGIWTFCMCPGGHLMPTSAQAGHLAINGMSYHARNSGFANAAVVVNVRKEDFYKGHPLDGMRFQAQVEKDSFLAGGSNYHTPAQRLTDFLKGRNSKGDIKSSYRPGVTPARLDKVLPEFIASSLQAALYSYNQRMKGYISEDAIVAGVESKTSSPIMMSRSRQFESLTHPGLYPTGEGAGFAGGIVSASLDGVRVARAVLENAIDNKLFE